MASKDLEAVFSYLHSEKISINKEEFQFQVETHADYPSLLAFSDALHFFNIPNIAFNLSFDEIDNLPDSFIAFLGKEYQEPNLYHITKQRNHYSYQEEKKPVKVTKEELKTLWKSVVLLVEKLEEHTENKKSNVFSTSFFIAVLTILILSVVWFFSQSLILVIFGGLISIGLFLSIEAIKTELGIESKISNGFCNIVSNADCGQVINSTKNQWIEKVKISDISIWFFASQLFAFFLFSVAGLHNQLLGYIFISLVLSVPMTLYSIYFQYKIEKKWCPICLSIIGIVYLELLFLFFIKYDFQLNAESLVLFFAIFSIVAGLVYLLKPVFVEKKEFKDKYIKQLRFVRNYEVFKNTLQKSDTQFFEKEFIVLGNRESKKRISIVTSPFCGFCKDAHHLLDDIISRFGEGMAVSIRFNYDENSDTKTKDFFLRLTEIYVEKGSEHFMQSLKNWFENKNLDTWFFQFGTSENTTEIESKLKEIAVENSEKELNFTPNIFLNQYNFPKQYDKEHLEYFIADWIEDEEI